MANYTLGLAGRLYLSATAVTASATSANCPSTFASNVKDVKVSAKTATDSYSTRAQSGAMQYAPTGTDYEISFSIKKDSTDTNFTLLQTAFTGKTEVAAYAMDALIATAGTCGPGGNWVVEDFSADQGNDKVIFYTVTLKPSSFTAWVVV